MRLPDSELILVRGLFHTGHDSGHKAPGRRAQSLEQRYSEIRRHGGGLGLRSYERADGRGRGLANRWLGNRRGTMQPVDVVEIMCVDQGLLGASLASEQGQQQWRELFACERGGHDEDRSFLMAGRPLRLLQGGGSGQRLFWFGNGLDQLSRAEFIAHYTTRHGPLVAGHAQLIGLRNYLQVPAEELEVCDALRQCGLGRAFAPAVFAQLLMGAPPFSLSALRGRRAAAREIAADEKRHIGFERSMLMLTARGRRVEIPASDTP